MERSEPTLVPEWLRCSGSVSGSSTSAYNIGASSLHPDLSSATRSRSFRSICDSDNPRSAFVERSSSNSRRSSSSNGSSKHPYSSFTRSHRDRNYEKEKTRSVVGDLWDDDDDSDPLGSILSSRGERSTLKRSQSLASKRPGEILSRRIDDSRSIVSTVGSNLIGIQKTVFEKDFPSLGTEVKHGASGIKRVPSPVLTTSAESLAIGSSRLLGAEKWTSALAEVPPTIGTNGHTLMHQNVVATSVSAASSSVSGLNMAEALSHSPRRAPAALQVPDKNQRLEELFIKQSRQLIPVVPNSSDKSKQQKSAIRTSEVIMASKIVQQQSYSSQLPNQSRGGQVKSDASNTSHGGKFLVLKPARENELTSAKDASSQTNNSGAQVSNGPVLIAPSTPTALLSPSNLKVSALGNRTAALSLNSISNAEKRSSLSQARSRSDFFNLMRRKNLNNTSNTLSDSSVAVSSPELDKSSIVKEVDNSVSPHISENGNQMTCNGDSHVTHRSPDDGDKKVYSNGSTFPDEEEAAFLRSLGWEENAGEDEGLTEEEINAFYREYMKSRPSPKVWRSTQPKCLMLSELRSSNSGNAASESSSSGPGFET